MNAATTTYTTAMAEGRTPSARGGLGRLVGKIVAALTILLVLAVALGPTRAHAFDLTLQNVAGAKPADFTLMFKSAKVEKQDEAPRRVAEAAPRKAGEPRAERKASAE